MELAPGEKPRSIVYMIYQVRTYLQEETQENKIKSSEDSNYAKYSKIHFQSNRTVIVSR